MYTIGIEEGGRDDHLNRKQNYITTKAQRVLVQIVRTVVLVRV